MKTKLEQEREVLRLAAEIGGALGSPETITDMFDQKPNEDERDDPGPADAMCLVHDNYDDPDRQIAAELLYTCTSKQTEQENRRAVAEALRRAGARYVKAAVAVDPPAGDKGYRTEFTADEQVTLEEKISASIFGYMQHQAGKNDLALGGEWQLLDEEDCNELGRRILLQFIKELRPDLLY